MLALAALGEVALADLPGAFPIQPTLGTSTPGLGGAPVPMGGEAFVSLQYGVTVKSY